jgi:hypothetical protein
MRDGPALAADFVDRLLDGDPAPASGWATPPPLAALRCHPDLVDRLAQIARPVCGTTCVFVAGAPVVAHRNGRAIAAAWSMDWLAVRSDLPAGAITSTWAADDLLAPWQCLDPWAADVAFAKSTDLLRMHVRRAYELAEQ